MFLFNVLNTPKSDQLKHCNIALMIVALLMLISSVQMEVLAGDNLFGISFTTLTFIHSGFGIAMFSLAAFHLYLHFGLFKAWLRKLSTSKKLIKMLAGFGTITLASGVFILVYMLSTFEHNLFGAIHGKIGFIFLALSAWHIVKHRQWIKRKIFS